jgi:thioredoxin 1
MRNTIELTGDNFQAQVLDSDMPVLVDFGADWCPPCRMLEPIVDQLAAEYASQMRVGSFDVDAFPEIQQRYGIMGLPTLILFQKGEPVRFMVGYQPRQRIESQIKPFLDPVTSS